MATDTMFFCRPDEWWSRGGSVSGSVDSDYQAAWLVDGRPGYPVRAPNGSPASMDLSLTVTNPAGEVGVVLVANHNLIVPVTLSGGVSATITPAATRPPHGIQLNPFALISPAASAVTSISLAVTANDEAPVIGEFVAAKLREITPVKVDDADVNFSDFAEPAKGERLSVLPHDKGAERRVLKGSQFYDGADLALLKAWWQSQRAGSLPSVLIPDPDENDAWLVHFSGFRYRPWPKSRDLFLVDLEFIEYPRTRW